MYKPRHGAGCWSIGPPVAGSQEIAVGEARPGWRPQARIVGEPAGQPAEPIYCCGPSW